MPKILDNLTDDELKKEAKNDSKNDAISSIIKSCKLLVSRVPDQEEMTKNLQIFKLRIILRYCCRDATKVKEVFAVTNFFVCFVDCSKFQLLTGK